MLSHQEIKYIRSLHQKKYRDEHNLYLAEGTKLVKEALINRPDDIESIFFSTKFAEHISELPVPSGMRLKEISQTEMERISSLKTPQGIIAVMRIMEKKFPGEHEMSDLTILLDQISDPGNFGTIIRLADWFGISNIICSTGSVEIYNPKVVQASMGAIFRTNLIHTSIADFIKAYGKAKNITVYGTTLNGENLFQAKLKTPAFILFGNETRGLSADLCDMVDVNLRIPDYSESGGKTESLNVSIAAAIVCAEFRRQTGGKSFKVE